MNKTPCDSREWWSKIEEVAEEFDNLLNKKGNKDSVFFQYNSAKLTEAFKIYEDGWQRFKEDIYEDHENEIIDRHKIAAMYILSLLIARPFDIRTKRENLNKDERRLFWANELFSLEVMIELISLWREDDSVFEIGEKEKSWFLILLNHLKLEMIKLNLHSISLANPSIVADILALAQIIYYIEKPCAAQAPTANP